MDVPQYANCLPYHLPKKGMMIIENTVSICLNDSSHSSCIIAASSSSSYELLADDGYEMDEPDDDRRRGKGIGITGRAETAMPIEVKMSGHPNAPVAVALRWGLCEACRTTLCFDEGYVMREGDEEDYETELHESKFRH